MIYLRVKLLKRFAVNAVCIHCARVGIALCIRSAILKRFKIFNYYLRTHEILFQWFMKCRRMCFCLEMLFYVYKSIWLFLHLPNSSRRMKGIEESISFLLLYKSTTKNYLVLLADSTNVVLSYNYFWRIFC
jgi:hypothetical protein